MNPNRAVVRITSPAELLSAVPYVLGFEPRQSLVTMAFQDTRLLSVARVDLPDVIEAAETGDYRTALADLAAVLDRHGVRTVILAGYGTAEFVGTAVQIAGDVFAAAGIPVRDALRVSDRRYYRLTCQDPTCCPPEGIPFDPTTSVVAATATFAGFTAAGDRDELLSQLAPVGGAARDAFAEATAAACARLVDRLDAADAEVRTGDLSAKSALGRQLVREAQAALIDAMVCYRSGRVLDDDHAAVLTVLLNVPQVHGAAARLVTGEIWQIQMWSDLVRRAEPDFVADVANLLAICALRAGNGVLAALAAARAMHAEPDNQLAHLLRQAIAAGMSPDEIAAVLAP